MNTRKITMTVFCLKDDADFIKKHLHEEFFKPGDFGLAYFTVEDSSPTKEEEEKAMEVFCDY